ncbi:substrate-binding domain-containing protein [Marivita sp. GX14005]|uniref:LacI family DNA-binding transcriptional regulator n=1 Tax=Marivita sp. GX14005 TaxID=2942276 RepID=UPI0020191095|nr:substrate-binding domain-containing protein [Marivita sp. GX14005]MCL3882884.1 substrate-binding domain-containing protein [Marivita sp. GX14005]
MPEFKSKKADIIAVAKAARVSASTVSRYFNHPELLKPATRKRIESAVRKTGYIRNRAAQTIHGIRSATIGVLIPTLDHAIFAEVVQAFSDTVAEQGFTILLASHGYDLEREYAILRKFLEHRVDGVVLTGLDHDAAVFQLIDSQQIPCVLMWNYAAGARYPSIGADNEEAGRMIAEHVIALGHARVACMFPPTDGNDRALARRDIVYATLAAAGIAVPEPWQLTTVYSISESKEDATRLFAGTQRPTVLICGNDILAMGALYAAQASGLDVPGDISIVGIGDFKGASEIEPALTTVRLPARRIGRKAGQLLAAMITAPGAEPVPGIDCAPELIIRQSSGPPAKGEFLID